MALTQIDINRETRRKLATAPLRGVSGAFLRAAIVGAFALVALAFAWPVVSSAPLVLAVVFYVLAAALTAWFVARDYPHARLGLCNYVTLLRLVLVCALGVHVLGGGGASWVFLTLALVALALDGVDGWLARRQGLASAFGARFDVEVDALLALVLAVNAAMTPQIGLVAVVLGLPRYVFVLASQGMPWLRGPLPERFSRKVVCVLQLGALIALQAPGLPLVPALGLMAATALALLWSFAVDILWLWRARA